MKITSLPQDDIDRIVEMAWEDRTPFEAIELQFGLLEKDVITLMRREMQASSFKMWRERFTSGESDSLVAKLNTSNSGSLLPVAFSLPTPKNS
jgi:uncharacterized protein (TIGR03643 family)